MEEDAGNPGSQPRQPSVENKLQKESDTRVTPLHEKEHLVFPNTYSCPETQRNWNHVPQAGACELLGRGAEAAEGDLYSSASFSSRALWTR